MTVGWSVPEPAGRWLTCALCGALSDDDRDIRPHLWPTRDGRWVSGTRCTDHLACRARLEAKGGTWPVAA